ncbi:MAG: flavodoxin family protein [Spirochaetes bacterium]|nr:flavodoxin family protein [Spirochaetota bacterium]
MSTVLGIVGSPRKKGNTSVLVSQLLRGARSSGMRTETVYLADLVIGECDGCHRCWQGAACPKNDDMYTLYTHISKSDAVVFGTPVYWFGPTALMKLFLDRFVYFNCPENRGKIRNTRAVLVAPFEDEDEETALPLVSLFEKSFAYLEMELFDTLLVPGVTKPGEVRDKHEVMKKAFDTGKNLASC